MSGDGARVEELRDPSRQRPARAGGDVARVVISAAHVHRLFLGNDVVEAPRLHALCAAPRNNPPSVATNAAASCDIRIDGVELPRNP